jgi:hypothetical protein
LVKISWMNHRNEPYESPLFVVDIELEAVRYFGAKSKLTPSEYYRLNPVIHSWLTHETGRNLPEYYDIDQGIEGALTEFMNSIPEIEISSTVEVSMQHWRIDTSAAVLDRFEDSGVATYEAYEQIPHSYSDALFSIRPLPDFKRPADLFQELFVLSFDDSQRKAISAISSGGELLIQGPPGTGKSQTIANAVANAVASGKTVAVISTRKAALDAVQSRLEGAGLGNLILRCTNQKSGMSLIASFWRKVVSALDQENSNDIQQLKATRKSAESQILGQLMALEQRKNSLTNDRNAYCKRN